MPKSKDTRPSPESVEARPVSGSPEDFLQIMQELRDAIQDNGKILGRINVGVLTGTRDLEKSVRAVESKIDHLTEAIGSIMWALYEQMGDHSLGGDLGKMAGTLIEKLMNRGGPPQKY